MKKNELISVLQGICLFFGIWFTVAMLFYTREGSSELLLHAETLHAIKSTGMSIIMLLSIIALQMFRNKAK